MTAGRGTPVVKCLVWDLDDTLWDGVVLEGDDPKPFQQALETLATLDRRGILHAVASRSDPAAVGALLAERGLDEWFCAIQIGWGAKSDAVRRIADVLGIGLDTFAFVDNDPAERAEVEAGLPMVRCYPAEEIASLPGLPEFQPEHVTQEAAQRRRLYRTEWQRRAAQDEFGSDRSGFLASLDLVMDVRPATEEDLARASELTVRTHQLNSTGITYDVDELRRLGADPDHQVLVARLRDRFGDYGIIGLAVARLTADEWVLRLLLTSCRVASRGAGNALLGHVLRLARADGRRPVAHFVPTDVNRNMLVTLRFAGFEPVGTQDGAMVLEADPERPAPEHRSYIRVISGAW
jgi:FkbH-like protein